MSWARNCLFSPPIFPTLAIEVDESSFVWRLRAFSNGMLLLSCESPDSDHTEGVGQLGGGAWWILTVDVSCKEHIALVSIVSSTEP